MMVPLQFRLKAAARRSRGMTLLELMVAVAVSTILILALANILGTTSGVFAETERSVESLRDGRAALGIIRNDMAGQIGPSRGLAVYHERVEGTLSTRWGFFTAQSAKAQEKSRNPGDLCYVLYYTAVTADGSDRVSRKLFRRFISSLDTLPLLQQEPFQPPAVDPTVDDVVAFNVLDFRCEFRRRAPDGGWVEAKTLEEIQSAGEMTVVLRVVSNAAALNMTSEADWSPGGAETKGVDFDAEEDDDASASSFRARFNLER
jgi:prepilin-type N-terminal cleavage/methylation domain-containing protein